MERDELIRIFSDMITEELSLTKKEDLVAMCVKFVIATTNFDDPSEYNTVLILCMKYLKKKGVQVKGDKLALPKLPIEEEPIMSSFDKLYDHLDNVSVKHPNIGLVELDQTATLVDLLKDYLFTNQVPELAIQGDRMFLSWGNEVVESNVTGSSISVGYDLVTWFEDNHLMFEVSSDAEIIDAGDFFLNEGHVDTQTAKELSIIVDNLTCEFE